MRLRGRHLVVALIAASLWACRAAHGAAETVRITIPTSVTFTVRNVSISTTGSPSPFTVSFSSASLRGGKALRISVIANAVNFTPPTGTTTIAASNISWTTSSVVGGTGSSGTLSSSVYTQVYQSNTNPSSGSFNLTWTLAAPGAGGLRSGSYTLNLTWKLESV